MAERVGRLEEWTAGHEKRCGDRYQLLTWFIGLMATILIGGGSWAMKQVFDNQATQLQYLQASYHQAQHL